MSFQHGHGHYGAPAGAPSGSNQGPRRVRGEWPPVDREYGHGYKACTPGRYRGLLVGVNYFGSQAKLNGCVNDVFNLKQLLVDRFGWHPNAIRVLHDDERVQRDGPPTHARILRELDWLVSGACPGDVLFFSFSGHGAQVEDPNGFEEDGMNNTLLLLRGLKDICTRLGSALDLPWKWRPERNEWQEEWNPFFTKNDVVMISGCEDHATSSDGAKDRYGRTGGALRI
eukprot:g19250.t1